MPRPAIELGDPVPSRLVERHRRGALVRTAGSAACWSIGLLFHLAGVLPAEGFRGVTACVVGLLLIGFPTLPLLRRWPHGRVLSIAIHGTEIVLYTGVIHFCGGAEAAFLFGMYGAMVAYVGIVLPRPFPLVFATASSLCLVGLVLLERTGLVTHRPLEPHAHMADNVQLATVTVGVAILYVIAYLASDGADLIRSAKRRLQEQNAALAEASRQALTAARLKTEFLANMSHEIRTPLNGVVGMTSLLMSTSLNLEQRSQVETIRVSGKALLDVINDILDLSKVEAGALDLEKAPFDLKGCVNEAVAIVLPTAREKGLGISVEFTDRTPGSLCGDSARVRQILVNLLSNAVKFTPSGAVAVRVDAVPAGDRFEIACEVEDSGVGIPPDKVERLFQPFAQLDASTTRKFGGTGLGLAICRRLAALMQGAVCHFPGLGGGSVFRVTLRLDPASAQVAPSDLTRILRGDPVPDSSPSAPLQGLQVLVVDDNAVNLLVAVEMLKHLGYDSRTAANGLDALAELERDPFDLVLMDLEMPEMDGVEATKRIRSSLAPGRQPYIVGVSAHALASYRDASVASGMNDYVTKPLQISDVAALLARYIAARNDRRPVGPPTAPDSRGNGEKERSLGRHPV